jgi:hypothetical protein
MGTFQIDSIRNHKEENQKHNGKRKGGERGGKGGGVEGGGEEEEVKSECVISKVMTGFF